MRLFSAVLGIALVIGLASCNSSDRRKADEQAHEAEHELSADAKKAGHEIKKDAKELGHQVDNAMGPNGTSAGQKLDHATLTARVKSKLAADAGLSTLSSVDVDVNGSVVTLSGTAANGDQRKAAEVAAAQVEGVTQVRNQITVRP